MICKSLKDKTRNKNTEKCTNAGVKRFQKWQEVGGVTVNLPDFDTILQKYFAELRTRKVVSMNRTEKGGEYEPDSQRTMLGAIHRYVKEHRLHIIQHSEFSSIFWFSEKSLMGKLLY